MISYIVFCSLITCVFSNIHNTQHEHDGRRYDNDTTIVSHDGQSQEKPNNDAKSPDSRKESDEDNEKSSNLRNDARRYFNKWFNYIFRANRDEPMQRMQEYTTNTVKGTVTTVTSTKRTITTIDDVNKKSNDTVKELVDGPRRNNGWSQHLYDNFVLPKFANKTTDDTNIYEAIQKLTQVTDQLNDNINKLNDNINTQNNKAYVVLNVPKDSLKNVRIKRDLDVNNEIVDRHQDKDVTDGRRSSKEFKYRLTNYFKEILEDLNKKTSGLPSVKEEYYHENAFKIGYLMANLDILEKNIYRFKKYVDEKAQKWDDYAMIETFDTLKVHHFTISKLIRSLKYYLEKEKERYGSKK